MPPFFLQAERNFFRALPLRPLAVACWLHDLEIALLSVAAPVAGAAAGAEGAAAGAGAGVFVEGLVVCANTLPALIASDSNTTLIATFMSAFPV